METQIPYTPDASQLAIVQRKLFLYNKIQNGINWFYWIAGLSIFNTLIYLFGAKFTFVIGLGATQFIDGFMSGLAKDIGPGWSVLRVVGLVINMFIAGFFVVLGFLGRKRFHWLIIIGMVFYALDGLLLLLFKDIFGAAFHAWALFGIWGGFKAIKDLEILEKSGNVESIEVLRQRMPSFQQSQISPQRKLARLILVGLLILVFVALFVIASLSGS